MDVDIGCILPSATIQGTFACTLNLVDVKNNNNKFYIIQLIESKGSYFVFSRYGRVGEKGVSASKQLASLPQAIKEFSSRYKSKTGVVWGDTKSIPGKYIMLEIETATEIVETPTLPLVEEDIPEQTKNFLNKLTNKQTISKVYHSFQVDEKKLPLGKISSAQIAKAHDILGKIDHAIDGGDVTDNLSSQFWTLVPYASGRSKAPPIIDTKEMVQTYADFLNVLSNLKVTNEVTRMSPSQIYHNLGVELEWLDEQNPETFILKDFITKSHGPTHRYKLSVTEIIKLKLPNSHPLHKPHLLFHGSRTANFFGILKEGLRIPASNQVVNGAALGRGIYFADCVTKSFNYCSDSEGYVLLSDVELGDNPEYLNQAVFDNSPHASYTSRIAEGKYEPEGVVLFNDAVVPCGIVKESSKPFRKASSFFYNEYVIFEKEKYVPKYLIGLKKVV